MRTNSTDRLREIRTKGGGGLKIPKILRTSFMYGPLSEPPLRPSYSLPLIFLPGVNGMMEMDDERGRAGREAAERVKSVNGEN